MNLLLIAIIVFLGILITFIIKHYKVGSDRAALIFALVIGGILNVVLTYIFTGVHVLSFGKTIGFGMQLGGVPLGHLCLCFLLPYAFLAIYLYLNTIRPIQKTDKYSLSISNVLMGLSIAMIFFAYNKALAAVTFSLMLLALFYIEYRSTLRFMLSFYRAYLFGLVLFLLIFVPLHLLGLYRYAIPGTIELTLAYIPFEGFFYFFTMGLISVFSYESIKRKR